MTAVTVRPDIAHPATYAAGVPYAEFARRRRDEPVGWVEEPALWRHSTAGRTAEQGTGYWAVTRYDDVLAASRRPDLFSSQRRGAFLADPRTPADLRNARQLLVNLDAPQHARALVRAVVTAGEFDVVTDLAAELPLLVLADLLGLPRDDRHLLYRWSNHLVGFDDPEFGGGDVEAYRRTFAEAFQYALALAADRRAEPRDDLATMLATAEVDGRRLSDREFCHFWLLLVVAGNETTRHLVSGSLAALAADPVQAGRLADGEVAVGTAVEELIRWVTPIMQFRRTATAGVELSGQHIAEGDKVVLYYTSANRDEGAFAGGGVLDLGRDPNPHLAFGVGPHFCLGVHLARLELATMLEQLRPYLSGLTLTAAPVRLESNFVNAVKSMPARLVGAP